MRASHERPPWRGFGIFNPFNSEARIELPTGPRPNRKIETKAIPRSRAYLCPKCDCVHRSIRCPECGALSMRLQEE